MAGAAPAVRRPPGMHQSLPGWYPAPAPRPFDVAHRFLVLPAMVLRQGEMAEKTAGLLVVWAEPQAAQQGIDGLVEVAQVDADPPEREIAEREIRAEIDGALRLGQRLRVLPLQHA